RRGYQDRPAAADQRRRDRVERYTLILGGTSDHQEIRCTTVLRDPIRFVAGLPEPCRRDTRLGGGALHGHQLLARAKLLVELRRLRLPLAGILVEAIDEPRH